jgi:tRNA(Ile)-lysidine synthase
VLVSVPGLTLLPKSEWMLQVEVLDKGDLPADWAANADPWRAFLDSHTVGAELWLRTRRAGDRFQPQGMRGHTVKLADFLTNQKVPLAVRDLLPLLEGEGGIVWVCGQRVDERARVQDATERVLVICFRPWEAPDGGNDDGTYRA